MWLLDSCNVLLKVSCVVNKNWDVSQLAMVFKEGSENKFI